MSYVIQNFSYISPKVKLTLRTRAAFLARNSLAIYTLLTSTVRSSHLIANPYPNLYHIFRYLDYFFVSFAKILFTKPKFLRYTPIGINFPATSYYRCIWNLTTMFTSLSLFMPFPTFYSSAILHPYFTTVRLTIMPITKKSFALTMHKFLRMNLDIWFLWPRSYVITSQIIYLNSSWLLLRFLNKYFFKIYHI